MLWYSQKPETVEGGATALGPDGEVSLKGSFPLEDVIIISKIIFLLIYITPSQQWYIFLNFSSSL